MDRWTRRILTVSELSLHVRDHLHLHFSDVWVEGKVSNLREPGSGHIYFTLKDHASQMRAVVFRSSAQLLRFSMREGIQVIVRGRLTVYEPRGEYQIVLDYIEPKGLGALQIAFEQLKEKLATEGLFDQSRKRPLPFFPRCVGIVTSLSGAAIRDMLAIAHRRCPYLSILIVPVPVQGDEAAARIASALRELGAEGKVDVIIVGRGGGTLEDLWAFNEEAVVRAIADSPVPVISAVGHEIDFTLADFAADYRAPTPSAAAEAVAPIFHDLLKTVRALCVRQAQCMRARFALTQQQISGRCAALPAFTSQLQRRVQRLDDLEDGLWRVMRDGTATWRREVLHRCYRLDLYSPMAKLRTHSLLVPQFYKRLEQRSRTLLVLQRQALHSLVAALDNLSPLAILARGYGIVQRASDGRVVKNSQEVSRGDGINIKLAEGRLLCVVRDILSNS